MNKCRIYKSERGAVMMETIITLPVYLFMIAGLFWLGDLCLARLALINGESVRVWENGNRHSSALIAPFNTAANVDAPAFFWFMPNNSNGGEVVTGASNFNFSLTANDTGAAFGWGQIKGGRASLDTKRSAWSLGIAAFLSRNYYDELSQPSADLLGDRRLPMLSRTDNAGNQLNFFLHSRRDGGGRSNRADAFYTNQIWQNIYLGNWGGYISPLAGGTLNPVATYPRNITRYLSWSN